MISLSQKPKPPLKRTNGTTYSIQGDVKDCFMSPKSNSHYNNMEEMSYNDTLAGQKWHPIEIESEDEERFLPSDLLVDSNLVQWTGHLGEFCKLRFEMGCLDRKCKTRRLQKLK